ncbi:class I SAM-dependent methyltransferase [Microbacterium fluvii]|uniref:Class I SAM-dependent methyltransferase n=1 Tax=Microbacterium fluvii TaxID=415215 RepID=A0ABW2HGU4_9MICO|nr:class I SAM-dependent methyltransferase [Microbacterium fluvii]MCU4672308.1 class I SAM-dependent methyltransferase [Microbacterium fluvii]
MATRDEMSRSFGSAAEAYEQGRPGYPVAAVEWMLQPLGATTHAPRVADIGAGTGKLTRALVDQAVQVVAVDPDAQMLARLHAVLPTVPTFVGSAEALPLPDASLDAAVFGQAWHWVEPGAASLEVGRVVRQGGVLGLVWNIRDEGVDWVRRMTAIMHGSNAEQMISDDDVRVAAPFGALERARWTWSRPMTRAGLLAMVRSRSYVITAEPVERARIESELAALFDEVGAVGEAAVELPYVTEAFRAIRE